MNAVSHGALMGARRNSGVILCQLLRGIAEVFAESRTRPGHVQRAQRRGAELGYAAVAEPVEGTVLTVARAAAEAAESAAPTTARSSRRRPPAAGGTPMYAES